MRFDLTNASYRVLDRASKYRLSAVTSEINAAKILLALFEEEECRAADWLGAAGLSSEKFCTEFGIQGQVDKLESPISAPSFPVGSYGVPAGWSLTSGRVGLPEIEASPAGNNAPPVGHSDLGTPADNEHQNRNELQPEKEPVTDIWDSSESSVRRRTYSIHSRNRNENDEPNFHSRIRFYLDDQPVHPGRVSKELESVLEIILHRFIRFDIRRLPVQTNGGITTISSRKTVFAFSLATEHLLLAVVLDDSDVGFWLREHGFDPAELYQRIEGIGQDHLMMSETSEPNFIETVSFPPNESEESDKSDGIDEFGGSVEFDKSNKFEKISEPNEILNTSVSVSVSLTDDKVYRLLDAASNRGKEAVRVIEDFVRFFLNHPALTQRLKEFRHEFQEILKLFPTRLRLTARNTEHDVGTILEGSGEYRRDSADSVLAANFGRLQESLRSLEEFSKLIKPEISRRFEQLRYQCYTLQKNVTLIDFSPQTELFLPIESSPLVESSSLFPSVTKPDIALARLYVLTDIRSNEEEFTNFVQAVLSGGAEVIQLRDKKADDRTLLSRSRILKEQIIASGRSVIFVMNDRPDLARIADADGVHVGQEELPVDAVRQIVGTKILIGVSTHCIEQARQAVLDGADYIGAGPVFETPTKEFSEIAGIQYLQEVVSEIKIPVFAIGGITVENLDTVLATGIKRIAVSSLLLHAADPQKTATELRNRLYQQESQLTPLGVFYE
ncbi:MAG: thiamine phosphate synthase [Planctomycetaceae bacterium]|jgi:thiamine-phosphate pyrophosphorylase|nr:thiamine phosphate synthase [Planctomycetaceae bacterium]